MRETIFSPCRLYRYTLWREWPRSADMFEGANDGERGRDSYVQFIGLNPSTADEIENDPTIRKCIGFATRWGFNAMCMTNLFAFRATDPKVMRKHPSPVGQDNLQHLLNIGGGAALVVAAWGVNGVHMYQDLTVMQEISNIGVKLKCLRKTKHRHPEHPLYIPYETEPIDL